MASAAENIEAMQDIRRRMLRGTITYQEAKTEAQPIIDEINAAAKKLADKYNQKPHYVSFAGIMR